MLRLWLLGLLAVLFVGADADVNHETFKPTPEFVDKQKRILELLYHPSQPEIATPHLYEKARDFELNNRSQEFQKLAHEESLYLKNTPRLRRNELFSIYHPDHLEELKALVQLFIDAETFEEFYIIAIWARTYENEEKFIIALYIAVLIRPDTRYIKLPPLYELYPNLYFGAEVYKDAIYHTYTNTIPGNVGPVLPLVFEARHRGWNVGHEETNLLHKLNYFVDDVGLNQYYTYVTLNNPFWLEKNESTTRGEEYLYTHKQLLNRYNLERLSNGLPFVEDFVWDTPFPIGYEPNLVYHNGLPVPHRQSFAPYPTSAYQNIRDIKNFESRIADAIDSGTVLNSDNNWINFNVQQVGGTTIGNISGGNNSIGNVEQNNGNSNNCNNNQQVGGTKIGQISGGRNTIGNVIQGNGNSVNNNYYGSIDILAKKILSHHSDAVNKHNVVPSVLQTTTVPLKDPAFFSIYNRIVGLYEKFKRNQKPYDVDYVVFKNLTIKSVSIDDLVTYIEPFETTINNGLPIRSLNEDKAQLINVIQYRLNHDPFTYNITVDSAAQQRASVKIFLGPKYDVTNKLIQFPHGYCRFFELDSWLVSLNEGENVISRSSDEALYTIPDDVSTNTFLENLNTDTQLLKKAAGFPQRLLLPKGTAEGQRFQLFVYIKPVVEEVKYESNVFGDAQFDENPLGFPLDRPIDQLAVSQDNYKLVDVTIKHISSPADSEISF